MTFAGISAAAAGRHPALAPWLTGAGIACPLIDPAGVAGRDDVRLLDAAELPLATHRDIILDLADASAYVPRAVGRPARICYAAADAPFAYALVAELVRAPLRPACGDPASAAFLNAAARIARSEATALVLGETGTGKEGLARFLHCMSPRAGQPFVAVNCAALPETMLEAMLFGHQKGSFTGAGAASEGLFRAADGGTLFLDEIAELPLPLQAKLLRALQEREVLPVGATRPIAVDVRVVAAANRDLAAEVAGGRFRADLYWRLNVVPLTLKPLRERPGDLLAIAAALMVRHLAPGTDFPWPSRDALARLAAHDWPGNVRELENVIQRALLFREGEGLVEDDIRIDLAAAPVLVPVAPVPAIAVPAAAPPRALAEVTRAEQARAIAEALAATGGRRVAAAARLGISERTLRYRLADLRANDMMVAA